MKNVINTLASLLFLTLSFPQLGVSQTSATTELNFEVNRTFPYISISKEKLIAAQTLIDLNERYKASWVKAYLSVEVLAKQDGQIKSVMGKSDTLNQKQKELLTTADAGSDFSVKVRYMPENNLKHNDPKELSFTVAVDPDIEAAYVGGSEQLNEYLKEAAINKIPDGSFLNYDLAAVQFTINEVGEVTNARLFDTSAYNSSISRKVTNLLLEAIQKMPCWKPAEYANGLKVKQDFVLTVGNMESCVVNLLNIRCLPPE